MTRINPRALRGRARRVASHRIDALLERPSADVLIFRVARRLDSPNTWRFHWSVGHKLTMWWERAFVTAMALFGGYASTAGYLAEGNPSAVRTKRRVTVTRQVPSKRNFIRDADDLRYTTKPINDALKRAGLIRDDSVRWLDQATPTQEISPDGHDWTIVRVEPVEAES